ncbi:MAG TPA: site-2 protease family protein [Phycisphaerales bacterium]|nr:site-2 protease family protein [Phycisphaerales bacterium]
MERLLEALMSVPDLLLVILGFSAIIIIHEAGHFFAARWAGIRVLAFAVGFGPALVSYRKGLGLRKGSSEPEYKQLQQDASADAGEKRDLARARLAEGISPTEYRLNYLPFGGYVKMLGQEDADPSAKSDEPDSYQNCVPWKRMIVISAGVVFNIITAAILFIIVFNPAVGLRQEPPRIGLVVDPEKPAYAAEATNARELGVTEKGLRPGDTVLSINGEAPSHFNDISLAVAMAPRGEPLKIDVQRPGVSGVLHFQITPEEDAGSHMLSIGVAPLASDRLLVAHTKRQKAAFAASLAEHGFPGLEAGMRLVEINGVPAHSPYTLDQAVERSGGKPVSATFADPANGASRVTVRITPDAKLVPARVLIGDGKDPYRFYHLLGLTPVLAVDTVEKGTPAAIAGLQRGDIFERIGSVVWPSVAAGVTEIRKHKDSPIPIVVIRQTSPGTWERKSLGDVRPTDKGQIGFAPTDSASMTSLVSVWPLAEKNSGLPTPSGGLLPSISPGSRITAINGMPVATLAALRDELKAITGAAPDAPVTLDVQLPSPSDDAAKPAVEKVTWKLTRDEVAALSRLGWNNPLDSTVFEPESFVWKADSILDTIPMGLHETHRVMMNTYLTFARLFQGTVKPEHLKGPVGIAHLGVSVAERGPVWLLFFLALISVNLAVINFLPMPIADGGHMVFLIYEQLTGRPPSVRFQNAAAILGLVLIGTLLIVVTFNDVSSVFAHIKRFLSS